MQANKRHFILQRQFFGIYAFSQTRRIGRAAAHCEIFTADNHFAAINLPEAEHEIGGLKIFQLALIIIFGHARAFADLVKTVFIEQCINALANGQATLFMMGFDGIFTALLFGKLAPLFNLVNVFIPAHVLRHHALV